MGKPTVLAALIIAGACTDHAPLTPHVDKPSASISDAVHETGNAHFYFLPPLVAASASTGAFDPSLLPYVSVDVCQWSNGACLVPLVAHFTSTDGTGSELIRLSAENEQYVANWHADALENSSTYRLRVLVAGTELGHADLDVVDNGAGLKNVDTEQYIGLVDGRTLPIKFRIEEGAVFVVGAEGGTIVAAGGQVILRIPRDALASPTGITLKPGPAASADEGTISGTLWEFGPDGTEFRVPAELTLGYSPDALPPELNDPGSSLVLATQEDGEWAESPTTVDPSAHSVTGPIFGFSVKAVAVKTLDVEVQPTSLILAPSATAELVSSARGQGGRVLKKRAVKTLSLDEHVATVDASGAVRAIGVGSTILRFTPRLPRRFPAGADPCSLPYVLCRFPQRDVPVVVRRPVAAVVVSPPTTNLEVGSTVQLTAELRDADGNVLPDREVAWSSTAEDVARVDAAGLVMGRAVGRAEIRATSEGVIGSASVEVVPPVGVPTVPPGWRIETLAHIPERPVALAIPSAGGGFGADLYVATQGSGPATPDVIYRVTQAGDVVPFAQLLAEADPVDLAFPPSGSAFGAYLYVSANNRDGGLSGDHGGTIQRVDAAGVVSDFTFVGEASGLTEPRGFAFAPSGPFGSDLYIANHINPPMDVGRVGSAGGGAATFFEGGLALSDLAFGRGDDFGTDLYIADWEGCNCVRRLSPGAAVSAPVAAFPAFPGALLFGPGGAFGSNLYVAAGSIYQVSASGAVTQFAAGFGTLTLDALEFAPDGSALYVADAGAGIIYRIMQPGAARRSYMWSSLVSGTSRNLTEIWGSSSASVFATATEFDILHFDGLAWSTTFSTSDTFSFRGLSGRSASDMYAVGGRRVAVSGSCGGVTGRTSRAFVIRFDGTGWGDAGFPFVCNSAHRGVWVGPQSTVAVGNSPFDPAVDVGEQIGRVWRLQNGTWTLEFSLSRAQELSAFLHAWGSGEQDVYAVGGRNLFSSPETPLGIIAHYDGTTWSIVSDQIEHPLNAVWGTSPSDVFAVGQGGLILHFDGTQWTQQESGVTVNLNGIWGSAPNNVLVVGAGGAILQWDGQSWTRLDSGSTTSLTGVWMTASGDRVFVSGQAGVVLLGTAQ